MSRQPVAVIDLRTDTPRELDPNREGDRVLATVSGIVAIVRAETSDGHVLEEGLRLRLLSALRSAGKAAA